MQTDVLINKIREAISRELQIPDAVLSDNESLRRVYGLDSVAAVNIVFALENELGIDIDIRRLANVDSINDLKRLLLSDINS